MGFGLVITAFVCILFLCAFGRTVGRFVYLTRKIPGPSIWQLLTVHAKPVLGDGMVTHLCNQCLLYNHKPWGTWLGDFNYVVSISDCETISAVYKSKSMRDKPAFFYGPMARYVGKNLLTMNGPEYARHRKVFGIGLRKSLQKHFLRRMPKPMSDFVEALHEKAEGGTDVDIRSLVSRHITTLSVVSFTSASYETLPHIVQTITEYLPRTMELVQKQSMNPFYYWLFVHFKSSTQQNMERFFAVSAALDELLMDEKFRAASGKQDSDDVQDIAQAMILSHLNTSNCTDEEFCAEGRILLIGSFETTSFVVNTLLLLLALHQDVQQRVYDEINSVWEKDRPVLEDDLERLQYTEMVIKETLRLFPAIPLLGRNACEETSVNGLLVPAGSVIVINVMALHRNPEYFPDPLKFDPSRFSPEASNECRPYSYIPFSSGFRCCPGQLHGFVMMKLILCYVLKNFRILPGEKLKSLNDIKVKLCITMHLEESSLRLVNRSSRNS